MFVSKVKFIAVVVVAVLVLGTGAGLVATNVLAGNGQEVADASDKEKSDKKDVPKQEIAKTDPPQDKPVDAERLKKAAVVLRVKWLSISPPGGNPSDTVEVLEIIKNEPNAAWGKKTRIDYEPGKQGVPHDECTVYLEINEKLRGTPWALMGGGAEAGVSHVGKQKEGEKTKP